MIFLTVLVLARTGGAVIRNLGVDDLVEDREEEPGCWARNNTYELPTLSCRGGGSAGCLLLLLFLLLFLLLCLPAWGRYSSVATVCSVSEGEGRWRWR